MKKHYTVEQNLTDHSWGESAEDWGLTGTDADFKPNFRELILAEDKLITESNKLKTELENLKEAREIKLTHFDLEIKRLEQRLARNKHERELIVNIISENFSKE